MAIKRSTIVNFRIENWLLDELENDVKEHKFKSVSEAIREYVQLGRLADKYKNKISNADFLKTVDELKKNDSLFEWAASLKDNELDALTYAIKMEKEGRYAQAKLR